MGNLGSKYPHLHCGKNFLALSRERTSVHLIHKSTGTAKCNKLIEILENKRKYYGGADDSEAITKALTSLYNDFCP